MTQEGSTPRFGPDAILTPQSSTVGARLVAAPALGYLVATQPDSLVPLAAHLSTVVTSQIEHQIAQRDGPTELGNWLSRTADRAGILTGLIGLAVRKDISPAPVVVIASRHAVMAVTRDKLHGEHVPTDTTHAENTATAAENIALSLLLMPQIAKNKVAARTLAWGIVAAEVLSAANFIHKKGRERKNTKSTAVEVQSVEVPPKEPYFGPDAILTPANVVSVLGLMGNLDVARRLHKTKVKPSLTLFGEHVAVGLFDLFDGELAKKFGATKIGKWLDTLIDKIVVTAKLAAMTMTKKPDSGKREYPLAAFWAVAGREFGVMAYKIWVEKQGVVLDSPAFLNRLKVWVQQAETSARIYPGTANKKWARGAVTTASLALTLGTGAATIIQGEKKRKALKKGATSDEETPTEKKQSRFRPAYKGRLQYLLRAVTESTKPTDVLVRKQLKKASPEIDIDMQRDQLVEAHEKQILKGKRVVVSGATGSIGQALVRRYAAMGAEVIMLCRNTEKAAEIASKITDETKNPNIRSIRVDLTDQDSIQDAVDHLTEDERGIDILVNNAGLTPASFSEGAENKDDFMRVNYLGNAALTLSLMPRILQAGGKVVNMTARRSHKGNPDRLQTDLFPADAGDIEAKQHYSDAKLAGDTILGALQQVYGEYVGFFAVHPGNVWKKIGGGLSNPFHRMSSIPGSKLPILTPDEAALEIARISLFEEPGNRYEWGKKADLPPQITPEMTSALIRNTVPHLEGKLPQAASLLASL